MGDLLKNGVLEGSAMKRFFDHAAQGNLSLRDIAQLRVDRYNASVGDLNADGYNCKLCNNRGYTAFVNERGGFVSDAYEPCRCLEIRRSIQRLKNSGLETIVRDCTFERFTVTAPWQQVMVDKAKEYLAVGVGEGSWFFIGGQPGCGKTHICTAIARQLLYEYPLRYMAWESESKRLKAIVNEAEEYDREITKLKAIRVLYIDDLFKPVKDDFGNLKPPTAADVKLAFEILNHRYINHMSTIISSEWFMDELTDFDEATASRISERCGRFKLIINKDRSKNHRLSDTTVL